MNETKQNELIGKYFLSCNKDRTLKWQGQIMAETNPGYFLCDLFGRWSGNHTKSVLLRIDGMRGFDFFPDRESLVEAVGQYNARNKLRNEMHGGNDNGKNNI